MPDTLPRLAIHVALAYRSSGATDVLAQLAVAADAGGQQVEAASLAVAGSPAPVAVPGHAGIGERIWLRPDGDFTIHYDAEVTVTRTAASLAGLAATPLPALPADVVENLLPSRYCPTEPFEGHVAAHFAGLSGGTLATALADHVAAHLSYVAGASHAGTTAVETHASRQGVCRDYAHLLIALARAGGIPARFASVYAPRVTPPDFHAVAQLYLGDTWHLVDPTGMATAGEMAVIGVGRDAADVAFLTAFGTVEFVSQQVSVTHCSEGD